MDLPNPSHDRYAFSPWEFIPAQAYDHDGETLVVPAMYRSRATTPLPNGKVGTVVASVTLEDIARNPDRLGQLVENKIGSAVLSLGALVEQESGESEKG